MQERSKFGPPQPSGMDIEETRMEYLDYGGEGRAVLLLHGTGFLPWLWHPIAAELAGRHRVIAPALYAHRPSDPRAGGLAWLRLAGDVKNLCAALGLAKPFLVGHSLGATVAVLAHAAQGLDASGLVLIEPILLPPQLYSSPLPLEQHPLAARAIKRRNHWRDRREALDDFAAKPFFQSWDTEILRLYVEFGTAPNGAAGVKLACPPRQEAALFIGGMQHDPWPELPKVACPALVVEGQNSENRSWLDLRQAARLIPHGRFSQVPEAGHLVPMEKPAATARLVVSFLNQADTPTAALAGAGREV